MVGTSADDSDLDLILLVPSCETLDDVDSVPCVQVIDSTFAVDLPGLAMMLARFIVIELANCEEDNSRRHHYFGSGRETCRQKKCGEMEGNR